MANIENDKLVDDVLEQLDAGVEHMDGQTASRLRQARAAAIEAGLESRKRKPWIGWAISGLALAPAIVLAVMVLFPSPDTAPVEAFVADDIEILAAPVEVDLLKDLEFYRWMNERRVG